jgi:hypothetical protein
MVAREHQLVVLLIVDRDREHPVEPLEDAWSELLVPMDHHLGVCRRGEPMSHRLQRGTQFTEIVDLAVEHHDEVTLLVRDRLITAIDVADPQPLTRELDAFCGVASGCLRTAVGLHLAHPGERHSAPECATDSAHQSSSRGASHS